MKKNRENHPRYLTDDNSPYIRELSSDQEIVLEPGATEVDPKKDIALQIDRDQSLAFVNQRIAFYIRNKKTPTVEFLDEVLKRVIKIQQRKDYAKSKAKQPALNPDELFGLEELFALVPDDLLIYLKQQCRTAERKVPTALANEINSRELQTNTKKGTHETSPKKSTDWRTRLRSRWHRDRD